MPGHTNLKSYRRPTTNKRRKGTFALHYALFWRNGGNFRLAIIEEQSYQP